MISYEENFSRIVLAAKAHAIVIRMSLLNTFADIFMPQRFCCARSLAIARRSRGSNSDRSLLFLNRESIPSPGVTSFPA
jgi:hypothetical protein